MSILISGFLFAQEAPIDFEDKNQKFSKVDEGVPVKLAYAFTNTGNQPLIINDYKVNCTCTKVSIPTAPVAPSASDTIFVDFDTKGKIGYQERLVMIKTNQGNAEIKFKGVVKASEATKKAYKEQH